MSEHNDWTRQRRARNQTGSNADAAAALCAKHLQRGALANASRAALLAQRLLRLEMDQGTLRRKRELKEAADHTRAEAALAGAHKAIATLSERPKPHTAFDSHCSDEDWPDMLQRMIAEAHTQRGCANPPNDSQPVQIQARDSC